jgi:hypothetical protein
VIINNGVYAHQDLNNVTRRESALHPWIAHCRKQVLGPAQRESTAAARDQPAVLITIVSTANSAITGDLPFAESARNGLAIYSKCRLRREFCVAMRALPHCNTLIRRNSSEILIHHGSIAVFSNGGIPDTARVNNKHLVSDILHASHALQHPLSPS